MNSLPRKLSELESQRISTATIQCVRMRRWTTTRRIRPITPVSVSRQRNHPPTLTGHRWPVGCPPARERRNRQGIASLAVRQYNSPAAPSQGSPLRSDPLRGRLPDCQSQPFWLRMLWNHFWLIRFTQKISLVVLTRGPL